MRDKVSLAAEEYLNVSLFATPHTCYGRARRSRIRWGRAVETSQVCKLSSGDGGSVGTGSVFVVEGVVAEAAVQDADEAVAEGA
ncbi:hypothetical protein LAUMK191_01872 [Mycobacterium attenuatum]|uniref:Uncharacterized protein n=1 Tax=Mycobacterium attenuatum TaxID=2341086 RepID=A0A498PZ69_9MYCO|nr:hypothetical protein LAUMK136_01880 [Mycobacterium attenuatum]VBA50357.1 hypothetical protein LAUMK191_01872 [Mycobacterium attenuatum]VBA56083.1 hypothetical protein LAUMK41_01946 [Mycobacterium attenuatum]